MTDARDDTDSTDIAVATALATRAGQLLLQLRARMGFDDPDTLRNAGDLHSHEFLVAELARLRPDDAVLSEEGTDDLQRLTADRLWIVDPLDGTNEYGEQGRTDWAVHVALWERQAGGGITTAAVALPARRQTLSTHGGVPPLPPSQTPARVAVSRSRAPRIAIEVAASIDAVVTPIGSAGMKAMAILLGDAEAYIHQGQMKEWDSAAPAAVAQAGGLHVSRLDGTPLEFNTPERITPDLVICRPELAEAILEAVTGTRG